MHSVGNERREKGTFQVSIASISCFHFRTMLILVKTKQKWQQCQRSSCSCISKRECIYFSTLFSPTKNSTFGVTMTHLSPLIIALLATIYLSVTGFQCGSAETTSAKLYMSQKQYDKAEDALLKQVAKNPNDEESWYMLGQVRIELKKFSEANQAFDKALSISDAHKKEITTNKIAFWGRMLNDGIEAFKRGATQPASYDTAIAKFESAVSFQPDSAYTYYALSLAYSAKKHDAKAIESLEMDL